MVIDVEVTIDKTPHCQYITYPPAIVADGKASTTYNALNGQDDVWALRHRWHQLGRLTAVVDVPDACSCNKRTKAAFAADVRDDPSILYDEVSFCACHRYHNLIVRETKDRGG